MDYQIKVGVNHILFPPHWSLPGGDQPQMKTFLWGAKHYSVNTRQEAEHKLQSHSAIPPTLKSNARGHSIM